MSADLTEDQRRHLLEEVVRVLDPTYEAHHPREAFLLLSQHERLLVDAPLLVTGERGAGKSALFRFLKSLGADVRRVVPTLPTRLVWLAGFEDDLAQPATAALWAWAQGQPRAQLEHFWLGHLLGWLHRTEPTRVPRPAWYSVWSERPHDPAAWVPAVSAALPDALLSLDRLERSLRADDLVLVVGYDDLDRVEVGDGLTTAKQLVVALVGLWQSLAVRQRKLQARILLRPELADHVRTTSTDASKLRDRTLRLTWSPEDVFRVLLHRLAGNDALRAWLDPCIPIERDEVLGWLPPRALPGEAQLTFPFHVRRRPVPTQEAFGEHLVGAAMGLGPKKGRVYTWLLNHTRDGWQQHLPRVFLNTLRHAAEAALASTRRATGVHLLRPEDLEAAKGPTGAQRLEELAEVYPDAIANVRRLADRRVPMEVGETEAALSPAELATLVSIGVMTRRPPGRVDVPELFRSTLRLKRRGGTRRTVR